MGLRARISSRDGVISNLVSRNLQRKNISQEIHMFDLPTMTQDDKQVQFEIYFFLDGVGFRRISIPTGSC